LTAAAGKVDVKLLPATLRATRLVRAPHSDGTVPRRLFLFNSRYCKVVRLLSAAGRVLDSELDAKLRKRSDGGSPAAAGTVATLL